MYYTQSMTILSNVFFFLLTWWSILIFKIMFSLCSKVSLHRPALKTAWQVMSANGGESHNGHKKDDFLTR